MKRHHKWLVAIGLLVTAGAWLAWMLLTAESDIAPQGRLELRPSQKSGDDGNRGLT